MGSEWTTWRPATIGATATRQPSAMALASWSKPSNTRGMQTAACRTGSRDFLFQKSIHPHSGSDRADPTRPRAQGPLAEAAPHDHVHGQRAFPTSPRQGLRQGREREQVDAGCVAIFRIGRVPARVATRCFKHQRPSETLRFLRSRTTRLDLAAA